MQQRSKYLVLTTDYLLPLLLLALVSLAYLVVFRTPLFTIKKLECSLDFQPCTSPAVLAELDKLKGQNLLIFSPEPLTARLLQGDFMLRGVELTKRLPHTLTVSLLSVFPAVALQTSDRPNHWITLDQDYKVIALREHDPNVPVLTVTTLPPVLLGQKLQDQALLQALALTVSTTRLSLPVTKVELAPELVIKLTLEGDHLALLSLDQDPSLPLAILQDLLGDQSLLKSPQEIDLRFAQPVLRPR